MKQKYNSVLLKLCIEHANEEANAPNKNYKERFDIVPNEKPTIEVVEQSIQEKIFWDILPVELAKRILHCAIETSITAFLTTHAKPTAVFYKLTLDSK